MDRDYGKKQLTSATMKEQSRSSPVRGIFRKEGHFQYREHYEALKRNQNLDFVIVIHKLESIFKLKLQTLNLRPILTCQRLINQLQIVNINHFLKVSYNFHLENWVISLPSLHCDSARFFQVLISDVPQQYQIVNSRRFWLMLPFMKMIIT